MSGVEETYWYAAGQYAIPDACTGAVQYGYADAWRANLTAGNVLFIAATADNYLRAYNASNGEKLWQAVYQRVVRLPMT